jgi:hypothetical protein
MRDYVMKNKHKLIKLGILLCLFFAFAVGNSALAADITWDGSTDTDWDDPDNWTPAQVPGSGDNVTIDGASANDPVLSSDVTINNLTITVSAGNTGAATSLDLAGYTLTCTGNVAITAGVTAVTDNATITGTTDESELVVAGNLTLTGDGGGNGASATLDMGAGVGDRSILTVSGNVVSTNDEAEEVIDIAYCDFTLYGTITEATTTAITETEANVYLLGTSVVTTPDLLTDINKLVVNKTGIGSATQGVAMTIDTLIVTSGSFNKNAVALTIDELLSLADDANAELDISGAGNVTIARAATFGDDGIVTTTAATPLILGNAGTGTTDITLPDDISNLASLVINRGDATSTIYLSGDLTDAGVLTLTVGKFVSDIHTVTIGGAFSTANSANAVWDASNSSFVFGGATHPVFGAASVITTNSSTNFTINTTEAAGYTLHADITALNNLVVNSTAAQTLTLGGDLTLSGILNITQGTFVPGAVTVTVNGGFAMSGANAVLTEDDATLILNGPITIGHTNNLAFTDANFNLTIGGTGSISTVTPAASTGMNDFTMNRAGMQFDLEASGGFTIAGDLTITNGIVDLASNQTYGVTGATVISSGGKLIRNQAGALTFTGAISGAGQFDATGGAVITFDGAYNYTGDFSTDATTQIFFDTDATATSLQSSIENLHTLDIGAGTGRQVTLNGDLIIANTFDMANSSTLVVGANTLTLVAEAGPVTGASTLDATNSTIDFQAGWTFTNLTFTTNSATNISFGGAVTAYPTNANDINNLTVGGAMTMPATNMTINGNLEITGAALTSVASQNIVVYGTMSVDATGTFVAAADTPLYLYGQFTGDGGATWTTPQNIDLFVLGTGPTLSLPAGITDLNTIVLNRENGMKLNASLTGTNGLDDNPCITLTNGDLDLNGFNITLGDAAAGISENISGGSTIINNGGDGAYITTATGSTRAQNIASGIGLIAIAGDDDGFEVRRYPKSKVIAGVNISIERYYQILNQGAGPLTQVKFSYDNTELGSNSAGGLKLYYTKTADVNEFMSSTTIDSSTTTTTTPGSARGFVDATAFSTNIGAVNLFYALASPSGSTGVVRIFDNGAGDNYWNTAANWDPEGVPTIDDDATIGAYTVYMKGNNQTYYCKSLTLASASSQVKPYTDISSGDTVKLVINGNININNVGGNIDGVNSYGRLDIQIGDGNDPVESTITPAQDYSPIAGGNGFSAHNFTINNGAVSYAGDFQIRYTGDFTIEGTSVYQPDAAGAGYTVMYGGYESTQTIDVASIAYLEFVNLIIENGANVTTLSNFTITEEIKISGPNDQFIASNGYATFQPGAAVNGWDVFSGGLLRLWNVDVINNTDNVQVTPNGDVEIQGDFTYSSTDDGEAIGTDAALIPDDGEIIFTGANQKTITNAAGADQLNFYHLTVNAGTPVVTSSDFYVRGDIDVGINASLEADNGEVTFPNTAPDPSYIKNASTQTLEFFDLSIADDVRTSDSWTVKGDLSIADAGTALLRADNGTITFDNDVQKTIDLLGAAGGTLQLFKVLITDGSQITTADDFTIANNANNPTGSGLEIQGTGKFEATAGEVIFNTALWGVASDPGSGFPKTITNSSTGTLEFFDLDIATNVNNEVTTSSNFEIIGGATGFVNNNAGLGGTFTATDGVITFSTTNATIASQIAGATTFHDLASSNITTTLTADHNLYLTGDLIVDGASGIFTVGSPTSTAGIVKFIGTTQQKIRGTSTQTTPVNIGRLEIDKSGSTTTAQEVLLELDLAIEDDAQSALILTEGYLNLGSETITVGQGATTYSHLAAINGGTGTFKNVVAQAANVLLRDELFTVDGSPTLYNWTLEAAATLDGDLTVNGSLALEGAANDLSIGANTLTLYGNMSRTSGTINDATGGLVLTGTGTVASLSNSYFLDGSDCGVDLTFGRTETLGGNLTMADGENLTINTGIGFLNLGTNILTTGTGEITRLSGSITAGSGSTVVLGTIGGTNVIPANLFTDNICNNMTIGVAKTLGGDLTINGTLNGVFTITTGDNVLTFGPSAIMPAYTSAAFINGNLRRTVTSSSTAFPIGGTTYRPIELQFANTGSSQQFTIGSESTDPTIGRGGNPYNAVDLQWTIEAEGTDENDSLKVRFQWVPADEGNGKLATITNATFPAKWMSSYWYDYRNSLNTFSTSNPRVLNMASFPVQSPAALEGDWAVFNATANTDAAKDDAIAVTKNRVVITDVDPVPVQPNKPFKVTVQLQDGFGQPIIATDPFYVSVTQEKGGGTLNATITGVITAGNTFVEMTGLYTNTGQTGNILKADTTGGSTNWQPSVSSEFSILSAEPSTQSSNIVFTNVDKNEMTLTWTSSASGTDDIVFAKADTLLIEGLEFPVDGSTYIANSVYGIGSSIGDAVVLYKGTGTTVDVKGLSPNTTYYFYVFSFNGADGNENYRITPAALNPNLKATTGSNDDDVAFGSNDTRETSKGIGTNTPVRGTIKDASDVDWFNFSVTNASPNVRTILNGLPGNYNIEIYNSSGTRMRRGMRVSNNPEAQVINDLPAGTYTVKIYGVDGAYDATNTYTLKVNTMSNEIFSVTP